MKQTSEAFAQEPAQDRPAWSVLAGGFNPETAIIDGVLIGRAATKFWDLKLGSDGRRKVQAIELVVRAFDLCELNGPAAEDKIMTSALDVDGFNKQVRIAELTPELDQAEENDEPSEPTVSPVMNALRALISASNSMETVLIDDRKRETKDRWAVDGDTRRLAEATVRDLYLAEQVSPLLKPAEPVD